MAEIQKFLDLDYVLSLFDSTEDMMLIILIGAVLLTSIILLIFLLSSERKRLVQRKQFAHQARLMSAQLTQSEAVLASDEQLMMIWPNQASMLDGKILNPKSLRQVGALQNVIGLPKTPADILNFTSWLNSAGAEQVEDALQKLVNDGKAFTFFVKTKAIERVETSGHVVGQEIIFRIRDLKEDRLFLARANEKWMALETKVKEYDALVNISPLPTWLRDDDGKLRWVNEAYIQAVEAEDASNVVQDNIELVAPADVYKARQYFMDEAAGKPINTDSDAGGNFEKLENGGIEQQVFAVIKGERCNLRIQHQKIEGGIVATAFNATEYERVKDELKRYNQAHKQTLDKLKTAVAQFGPDQNLEFYNSSYQKLFGLDAAFLDSKPSMSMILEQIRNLKKMPEQSNFKSWRDGELDAFRQVESSEKSWHLPNGTNLHIIADPHPFGGVTFLYDDVTEHVALESRYEELDQIQSETLDNLSDGVAVFNSDGELQISNPAFAKIWQFKPDQLEGKPHVNKVLEWCQKQSQTNGADYDDLWNTLRTSVTAIVDERSGLGGRILCVNDNIVDYASIPLPNSSTLMTFTDVTIEATSSNLLEERNQALVAADQLKSDFISHMSYQFREPLTNILGFSEMLEQQVFGELNPKQLEYVDIIHSSSIGLRGLINDILDLASFDADRMELQLKQVDIAELIDNAVDAVKMPIGQKDIKLNRIVMPHIGSFAADGERVAQVLYNLLTNAIYFSDNESIVSIGAEKERNHIRLWVRDAGVGISDDRLETIFDKFNSDKPTGAGLGLTLVQKLVEFHGGEVKISSQLSKGTIVSCYFPIVQAETSKAKQNPKIIVDGGSNVVNLKPEKAVLSMVSAFVGAEKNIKPEPLPVEQAESEIANAPKKLSPMEQLQLLRKKTQQSVTEATDDKVSEVEQDLAERADELVETGTHAIEESLDTVEGTIAKVTEAVKDKSILGNSRLAALYQRGKDKKDPENQQSDEPAKENDDE